MSRRPVVDVVAERVPLTLLLGIAAELIALSIAVPLGTWCAARRHRGPDRAVTAGSYVLLGAPSFFVVLLVQLGLLGMHKVLGFGPPIAGLSDEGGAAALLAALAVPALLLGVLQGVGWSRLHRVEAIAAFTEPCIDAVRARGLPGSHVLVRHILPLTYGLLVTMIAVDMAGLVAGALLIETTFDLPGLGSLLMASARQGDVVLVMDLVVLAAVLLVTANALADLAHRRLDPRVAA